VESKTEEKLNGTLADDQGTKRVSYRTPPMGAAICREGRVARRVVGRACIRLVQLLAFPAETKLETVTTAESPEPAA
jgi:hypothetical protein